MQQVFRTLDRTCYQLREEGNVQSVIEEVLLTGYTSAINVNNVGKRLEWKPIMKLDFYVFANKKKLSAF